MAYDQEAQYYKDILKRMLTPRQLRMLEVINNTPVEQERAVIRIDPSMAVKRRKKQKKIYDRKRERGISA